jgi:DNA-binding FrmR family transcriptional regulator
LTDEPPLDRAACNAELTRRLARIEGQVRGIARMVGEERSSVEVLNQLAAVHQGLREVTRELLAHHMHASVRRAFAADDFEQQVRVVEELAALVFKYSR